MRLLHSLGVLAVAFTSVANAAAAWTFDEATLQVATKGAEPVKQKYVLDWCQVLGVVANI